MITDVNSEDRLVQRTFADLLEKVLGWESVYACNTEGLGAQGAGRAHREGRGVEQNRRARRDGPTACYPSNGVSGEYCISHKYLDRVFSV
jgi:hypothetical protein